jgi:peptide/nickel transport system permease protein
MRIYLLKRVVLAILTILFLATILFILFRMLPGDPTMTVLSPALSPEVQQEMRHRFGLDRPMIEQYFIYIKKTFSGDFGISFQHGIKVSVIIAERFWNTIFLTVPSLFLAYLLGIIIGAYIAWRRGSKTEVAIIVGSIVFRSAPIFWMAMIFILVFATYLHLFPGAHMRTPGYIGVGTFDTFFSIDFLNHLILPMSCSAIYYGCYPLLIMRTSMLEVLGEDFIDLAKAKGLSELRVIFKHAMRTSLLPIATSVSLLGAYAMAGSVLVETVFSWPGLGRLMVSAVVYSDYPLAQGTFLLIGVLTVLGNLMADILYGILDPRIRYR